MITGYIEYIKTVVLSIFHGGSRPNSVAAQHAIANIVDPTMQYNDNNYYKDKDSGNTKIQYDNNNNLSQSLKLHPDSSEYEDYVPTRLKLVIILSGKRKSGKDHISTMITNYIGYDRMQELSVLRIAGPIKNQFAKSNNLDFNRLLGSSEYKENYRLSMVEWSEKYREKTGWHCFLIQAIREQHAKHKRVWMLTDARRPCDIDFFEQDPIFSSVKIIKIRVIASDATRQSRGWIFDERVDHQPTECGLDSYKSWTHVITNDSDDNKHQLMESLMPIYEAIDEALDSNNT